MRTEIVFMAVLHHMLLEYLCFVLLWSEDLETPEARWSFVDKVKWKS